MRIWRSELKASSNVKIAISADEIDNIKCWKLGFVRRKAKFMLQMKEGLIHFLPFRPQVCPSYSPIALSIPSWTTSSRNGDPAIQSSIFQLMWVHLCAGSLWWMPPWNIAKVESAVLPCWSACASFSSYTRWWDLPRVFTRWMADWRQCDEHWHPSFASIPVKPAILSLKIIKRLTHYQLHMGHSVAPLPLAHATYLTTPLGRSRPWRFRFSR